MTILVHVGYLFIILAWCSMSYYQWKPGYYNLSTYGGWWGGGVVSTKSVLGAWKSVRSFLAMSDIYFYFFHFFFGRLKLFISPIRSIGSVWRQIKYMNGDNLGFDLNYAPIWERGWLRGHKCKNCAFLNQSMENLKLYPKISLRG